MTGIYADAGTGWTKVLELYKDETELKTSPLLKIKDLLVYSYRENELQSNSCFAKKNTVYTAIWANCAIHKM